MPTFRSHDGTVLHYRLVGEGPPLMVQPGGPGRASDYLGELGGLSRGRTLVLLDARGTGGSAAPTDPATYAWDRLGADLDALCDHLRLDVFDLAGHSAGARVAAHYAAGQWRRLRRLVLITPSRGIVPDTVDDTWTILSGRSGEPWYDEVLATLAELEQLPDDAPADQRLALVRRLEPAFYGRWEAAAKAHWTAGEHQFAAPAREYFFTGGSPARLAAQLAQVRVPVLVVAGELDCATGVEPARAVAGLFPRGHCVVLEGAGHFPWLDAPDRFVQTVEWFLS